jgi:hypothetical protein
MSNSVELQGRIKEISDAQTIQTQKGDLEKRVLTVELGGDSQYPVNYPVEAIGAKANLFNAYNVGDEVKVSVNLRSYTDRNGELRTANANAWKITYADGNIPSNNNTHAKNVEDAVNDLAF